MWCFCFTVDRVGFKNNNDFLFIGFIPVSKLLSHWYSSLKLRFRLILGNSMDAIHTLYTNLTLLCHIRWRVCSRTVIHDRFPFKVNRNGCHMWDRKFSLFPEHFLCGVHNFAYSLYVHNLSVLRHILQINYSDLLSGIVWLLCLSLIYLLLVECTVPLVWKHLFP